MALESFKGIAVAELRVDPSTRNCILDILEKGLGLGQPLRRGRVGTAVGKAKGWNRWIFPG